MCRMSDTHQPKQLSLVRELVNPRPFHEAKQGWRGVVTRTLDVPLNSCYKLTSDRNE